MCLVLIILTPGRRCLGQDPCLPPYREQHVRLLHHQGGLLSGWSIIRVVCHQGGLPLGWSVVRVVHHQGSLSSRWSIVMVVSCHGGLSSGLSTVWVVCYLGGLSSQWSFIRLVWVVCYHGGLSSQWPFIRVVYCLGGLLSGWSVITAVVHQGYLLPGWSVVRVVFRLWPQCIRSHAIWGCFSLSQQSQKDSRVSQAETAADPVLRVVKGEGQGWQVQVCVLSRYVPTSQREHALVVSLTSWPEGQSPVKRVKATVRAYTCVCAIITLSD